MDRAFQKDDRVRLNKKGCKIYKQSPPDRLGTVYHEPKSPAQISVTWDGTKSHPYYDHRLLERVDAST